MLTDEAKRILKKGGQVLLVEWLSSFSSMGPVSEQIIEPKLAIDLFTKRGFKFVEKISTNPHHYGIIFTY